VPTSLQIRRIGHLNHLNTDEAATRMHYEDLLGAQYLMDIRPNPLTAGYLLDLAGEIIEALIPKVMDRAEGKQLAKLGPHYSSIELLVPDLDDAKEMIKGRGIRLLLEGGGDFLTMPADTEGILLQVFDGDWHADPPPPRFVAPKRPMEWWRDQHPIGYLGLRHVTFMTDDIGSSRDFWLELCGGHEVYREARPDANAEAIGLDIGIPVELLTPVGDGPAMAFFEKFGKKIRSITFNVAELGRTKEYFSSRGITLAAGDLPGSLMLTAEDNRGGIIQFVE